MDTLYEALSKAKSLNEAKVPNLVAFPAKNQFGDLFTVIGGVWKLGDKSARKRAQSMIKALGKSIYNEIEDFEEDFEDLPANTLCCYAIAPTDGHFNAFIYGFDAGGIEMITKVR